MSGRNHGRGTKTMTEAGGIVINLSRFVAEPQQMKSTRKPSFLRRKMQRQNRRFCA
jgi:hypothetical protein